MGATSAAHLHRLTQGGRNAIGIEHLRRQDLQLLLAARELSTTGSLVELAERLRQAILTETPTAWTVTHVASAPRRRNPNLLVHAGDLYLFGGYSVHERYIEDRNVLLTYDASTGRFEGVGVVKGNEGKVPEARAGAAAAVHNGKLWVFGGEDGFQTLSDMHCYDFETRLWSAVEQRGQPPTPRAIVYCVVYNNSLLIYGFEDTGQANEDPRTIQMFDFATSTWSQVLTEGASPGDQAHVQAIALRPGALLCTMAFIGARRGHGDLHIHVLDLNTRRWSEVEMLGDAPSPRAFFSSATLGNDWVIQGGICTDQSQDGSGGIPTSDAFAFDFGTRTWRQLSIGQPELQRRSRHACTTLHDSIVYAGGSLEADADSPREQQAAASVPASLPPTVGITSHPLGTTSPTGVGADTPTSSSIKDVSEGWNRLPGADVVEALQLRPIDAPLPATALVNTAFPRQLRAMLSLQPPQGTLSDMELEAEGRSFFVHRVLLAAQSPIFASMFQAGMREQQSARVEIRDIAAATMESFLSYLYGGLLQLDPGLLGPLLRTADRFQVDSLGAECAERLAEGLSVEGLAGVLALADDLSNAPLREASIAFTAQHLQQVQQSAALQELAAARPQLVEGLLDDARRA